MLKRPWNLSPVDSGTLLNEAWLNEACAIRPHGLGIPQQVAPPLFHHESAVRMRSNQRTMTYVGRLDRTA